MSSPKNGRAVGFIGLGVMGEPMCRNLATRSGWRVLCHDLSAEPMQRLTQHGAEAAPQVEALVTESDVVMISLPSGKAFSALVQQLLPHARSGQVFVDLGTSGVDVARQAESSFGERGACFIDAPVARTRQAAEAGTLAIMVGGDAAVLEQVRPLLACMASDIAHCGPTGAGQITKILNNMVLFQTGLALAEAWVIARHAGFDAGLIFDTLTKGSGDSFALRNHGMKAILPEQFPKRAFSVEYARKDLSYALEMAQQMGIPMRGAQAVEDSFARAISAGEGESYWPVIARVIEQEMRAASDVKP